MPGMSALSFVVIYIGRCKNNENVEKWFMCLLIIPWLTVYLTSGPLGSACTDLTYG